jgi:hypothetical protein
MNRISSFTVLTSFLNHQGQEPLPEGNALHQTPIEVHTAENTDYCSSCEGIAIASPPNCYWQFVEFAESENFPN